MTGQREVLADAVLEDLAVKMSDPADAVVEPVAIAGDVLTGDLALTAMSVESIFAINAADLHWRPWLLAAPIHALIAILAVVGARRLSGVLRHESQLRLANRAMTAELEERKRVEAALRQANREAIQASRTKSEFLANISHELRTPLNAILGFSDILNRGLFGPLGNARYQDYAKDIHQSGRHLLDLINDILDISKIEARKTDLHETDVQTDQVARACLRMIGQHADAQSLELRLDVAADLPMLHADPRALKQILLNLLSNAAKFTPPGGRIELCVGLAEDGGMMLSVSDTGVGMAPEEIPLALEPFGQTQSSRLSDQEGTGLGLPLAKLLVELHGGRFQLSSRLGEGTMVAMQFPPHRTRPILPAARSA